MIRFKPDLNLGYFDNRIRICPNITDPDPTDIREAAKKCPPLVVRPLIGSGGLDH